MIVKKYWEKHPIQRKICAGFLIVLFFIPIMCCIICACLHESYQSFKFHFLDEITLYKKHVKELWG